MLNTLSGRFLVLTVIFTMLAEVLIFLPSVARFREDYLAARLERAQIASLVVLAGDEIAQDLQEELLLNAGVYNVVLRRNEVRQLVLTSPMPHAIHESYDLRQASAMVLIKDAVMRLFDTDPRVIRVIGEPVQEAGILIEVTMNSMDLRAAMLDYGLRVLALSAVIAIITASLLFLAVRATLVKPIKKVVTSMQAYAAAPEDARRIIEPSSSVVELREAETALKGMQTDLTGALRQKERLAQLGAAVAKISHDLRNILTSAQLFTDRIEMSEDPTVKRMAPKLVNSITRAVNLCESTLAFGKAEEPAPTLAPVMLSELVDDVVVSERLAVGEGGRVSIQALIPAEMEPRADGEQLYRVVFNLVRNARQAIEASGTTGEISVTASEDEAAWMITITDTGPGLAAKAVEHLFTAFQGNARKGGSGLGLVISAELIRGHGGELRLDYTGPEGTGFTICLPKDEVTLHA